jgi:nucleotide-binding universal stress UspA family protein
LTAIRHILALVSDGARSDVVLALAARLARRHGAAVQALHAVQPALGHAYLSPEAAAMTIQLMEQTDRERADAAAARVQAAVERSGLTIGLLPAEGDPVLHAAAAAHCSDLVVMAQRPLDGDDGTDASFAARLLVKAGAPLLLVPAVDSLPLAEDGAPSCGRRVLVAWSPTPECARALRDALPLLAAAEQVEVLRFGEPPPAEGQPDPLTPVCRHLARHGIQARAHHLVPGRHLPAGGLLADWNPDVPVAEALLSHAADSGADLIVMGGYGHARAWELALGGVTRTLLRSMTVPVLMAH